MVVKLGVAARVTVIGAAELSAIVRGNPLLDVATDWSRTFAYILNDPAESMQLAALAVMNENAEALKSARAKAKAMAARLQP